MALYSKNGSYPKPETDGTAGWIGVPDKPECPEGKEVVWWFPPGWVIRDPMPIKPGFKYNWSQSELKWVESEDPDAVVTEVIIDATKPIEEVVDPVVDPVVEPVVEEVAVEPISEEVTINLSSADTTNDPIV